MGRCHSLGNEILDFARAGCLYPVNEVGACYEPSSDTIFPALYLLFGTTEYKTTPMYNKQLEISLEQD